MSFAFSASEISDKMSLSFLERWKPAKNLKEKDILS